MVVVGKQVGLSISDSADLLGFFCSLQILSSFLGKNAFLMPEIKGEWSDYFKLVGKPKYLK